MENVNALKELYVALGGDASDVADMTLIHEVIRAMIPLVENIAEGGSEL